MDDNREMIVLNGEQIDELIRCKDCKYFGEADDIEPKYHDCKYFSDFVTVYYMLENDYCSCAERRKDDTPTEKIDISTETLKDQLKDQLKEVVDNLMRWV